MRISLTRAELRTRKAAEIEPIEVRNKEIGLQSRLSPDIRLNFQLLIKLRLNGHVFILLRGESKVSAKSESCSRIEEPWPEIRLFFCSYVTFKNFDYFLSNVEIICNVFLVQTYLSY